MTKVIKKVQEVTFLIELNTEEMDFLKELLLIPSGNALLGEYPDFASWKRNLVKAIEGVKDEE